MAKKNDVNWKKIKTEYITTDISQRKLAEKYKVAYPTLRDRCKAEGWYQDKKEYRSKVVTKIVEKTATKEASLLAAEYDIACRFVDLIGSSLNDDTYGKDNLDTKKVLEAANALTKFMDIKRIIKGHQTIKEQQDYDIAIRRLEIEEQRANQENSADRKIVVELPDEVKEWTV